MTNIALGVNVERLDRLRIALDFEAAERANLEVALGTDADSDGKLKYGRVLVRFRAGGGE